MSQMSFLFDQPRRPVVAYTGCPARRCRGRTRTPNTTASAFLTSVDLPKFCVTICASASATPCCRPAAAEQPAPVGVHAAVQRLVVEQLRRPLDGVDLGDLGGDHQPRHLEELVGRDVPVADDRVGLGRIAQPGIGVRRLRGLLCGTRRRTRCARARTRCERSSCRSSSCPGTRWPPGPSTRGLIGSPASNAGSSAVRRRCSRLRAVRRVALHALARALVVAVDLRGVPPRGVRYWRSVFGARSRYSLPFVRELAGLAGPRPPAPCRCGRPDGSPASARPRCVQPTSMNSVVVVAFSRWENQSWVMNWIQYALG